MSSVIALRGLDVTRLAADFSAAVRANHSEAELAAIRERNDAETDPAVDHVHDFCDANDLMADAISEQLVDWSWSDHADAISEAWQRAKNQGFRLSRVLVACEYSGIVRDAFRALGHDAVSCDILPSEAPGPHLQRDVREVMTDGWHLSVMHPPCTYLTSSAEWAYADRDKIKRNVSPETPVGAERRALREEALEFVEELMAAPIDQWALENPKGVIGTRIRPADQWIQPYQYGHDHSKTTGLWLHNLDPLVPDPDDYVEPRRVEWRGKTYNRWANQSPCGADRTAPGKGRGHKRSAFFTGIAKAMAEQWTGIKARVAAKAPVRAIGAQMELFA